jgi:hypothetical protein
MTKWIASQWMRGVGLAIVALAMSGTALADGPLPPPVPEIDGGMIASGLALLSGLAMVVNAKRRPRS